MISYEDCIDYIENKRESIAWQEKYFSNPFLSMNGTGNIKLLDCQKNFLNNLINGKITDCPRGFGKTMIINLYAEYLNYVSDMCKYDSSIKADDYISCDELVEKGFLSYRNIQNALYANKKRAMQEYCILPEDVSKYIVENVLESHIGKIEEP